MGSAWNCLRALKYSALALGTALATSASGQVAINADVTTAPGTGAITVSGNTNVNPAAWTYWTFCAMAGDSIQWEVDRLVDELDPVASVVLGDLEGAAFAGTIFDDPLMGLPVVSFSDDADPPFTGGGPFGDPNASFIAPVTGTYTIAVSSFSSAPMPAGGYTHRVTVNGSTAGTTASLVAPDVCLNAGETTLTVNIDMTMASDVAVGGQFFLQYDTTRLAYLGGTPGGGDFTLEIFDAEPVAGQIDYAVGVAFGNPGTMMDSTMAVLSFQVIGDACDLGSLVSFRDNVPPSRITNGMGENHLCFTNDLGLIRIDSVSPVLTLSSGLSATDNCADAPTVPIPGTYQFDTTAATNNPADLSGVASCGSSTLNADVWYMLVPPGNGTLTAETCGITGYDTVLEVLADCGGATVTCNDDSCGLQSRVSFPVRACVPVKLRLTGFSSSVGSGLVAVSFTPTLPVQPAATDACASAPPSGEGIFPFDTTGASNDGGANACTSGATPADVWIQYVPSFTGTGTAETCGLSAGDTVLHAYDACGGTLLACNDDTCGLQSRVTFPVTTGVPVWVRVTRFNGGNVSGSVRIPPPPPAPTPAFTLDRVVKADAGFCDAVVTFGATATDDCDGAPTVVCVPASGSAFPIGTTTVLCTAFDACGNMTTDSFDVTVLPVNEMVADVELAAVDPGDYTRCITFDLVDVGGCPASVSQEKTLWFSNGTTRSVVDIPCGLYNCASARDRLHTLRRTDDDGDFGIVGTRYVTDFTSSGTTDDSLIGGNFNDDRFIEILDFGIFAGQFGANYGSPSTDCATPWPHADASGDGLVTPADFTFIAVNFLAARETDCCGMASNEGPRDSIPVADLEELGYPDVAVADFTHDGWISTADVVAFMNGARPCPSDWNRDAYVNSADFFGFLTAFFAGQADYNRNGVTDSVDFFDYLTAFMSGC
jgi:hypothetical protein